MYLVVIWTLVIPRFLFFANANIQDFTFFFPPNLHAPCFPRYRFYFVFMIGFNFLICSIYVYWNFAHVILTSLHDCVSYFTFIVLFQHIQIMCVGFCFNLNFFFFFLLFWVLCGSQCQCEYVEFSKTIPCIAWVSD